MWAYAGSAPRAPVVEHPDVPIAGIGAELRAQFALGNVLFDAPARDVDGLGPLLVRTSCAACHDEGLRGPGLVQKAEDRGFGTSMRPLVTAGAKTPVVAAGPASIRVGPPLLGRGYIEAIDDSEIERVMREQSKRTDSIHGRINRVLYSAEPGADTRFDGHRKGDVVIGRFGLKARISTLEEFVADALQVDMGLTSPMRPHELPNPDGLADDGRPGIDIDIEGVRLRTAYVRLLAIPPRAQGPGREVFARIQCSACHVPSMRTRADHPIPELADRDAPIYSDLLLHDMGEELADGMTEGMAGPRDWRTAPLIGVRFLRTFLHDGRATDLEAAIRAHGGEAAESARAFDALSPKDRRALLDFVGRL